MKIVQLLDAAPGVWGPKDDPIVIIHLAHLKEIEMPLLLSKWDSRRLALLLLNALDTHGDPRAEAARCQLIGNISFPADGREDGDPAARGWDCKPR